jgi:hypothetical protein
MTVSDQLIKDLTFSLACGHDEGYIRNQAWSLHWRLKVRRIEDKARDNVFSIATIALRENLCGRGHFTALIRHLVEHPTIAGRSLDWLYIEQCRFRLGEHLRRELGFKIDDGMVIDAWRRTTSQMELGL